MAFLMQLIDDLNREMYNSSLHDHDFGSGLHPHHIQSPENHHHHHHQREPTVGQLLGLRAPTVHHQPHQLPPLAIRRAADEKAKDEGLQLSAFGKDGFQACLDVTQFKPNELNVKVSGNHVIVEGKHEEREDNHGYISRHFVRRYTLPKDYEPEKVISHLSSDGILTVSIPKPVAIENTTEERIIQIHQVGPAHLNIKPNKSHSDAAATAANGEK